ncbi:hypothetical protein VTL71DRAFT_3217 [Oculimacula yallundae]|uniref:CCHC-type domain-containing protein n=1 Tax=Oculimacula yallundae TaxID=86028 RepID=A0ABR4C7C6_9HELO
MPLRRTLSPYDIEDHVLRAQRYYPDLEPENAVNIYAEEERVADLFFRDKDGNRCVWRIELHYGGNPHQYCYSSVEDVVCRKTLISCSRRDAKHFIWWTDRLPMVDRPTPPEIAQIVGHPSESGWNLPSDHDRHLLKFPSELLNKILGYILTLDQGVKLQPITTTSNHKKAWSVPTYRNEYYHMPGSSGITEGPYLSILNMQDSDGPYTEYRHIFRKPIDATILRVNKDIHKTASGLLYGNNTLEFPTRPKDWKLNAGTCYRYGKRLHIHNPSPLKPDLTLINAHEVIAKDLASVHRKVPVQNLPGWMYHDGFLKFLYTIGPKNAALIRKLRFSGIVMLHDCGDDGDTGHGRCADDIAHSLKVYLPFLKTFCTGLETLIIQLLGEDDEIAAGRGLNDPTSTEGSLRPLLEQEIMHIKSLRKLVVTNHCGAVRDFALPTIDRVARRTKARTTAASKWSAHFLKLKNQRGENDEPGCGFCGEEHISAECWNLCNFCGEFGHFRKGCLPRDWVSLCCFFTSWSSITSLLTYFIVYFLLFLLLRLVSGPFFATMSPYLGLHPSETPHVREFGHISHCFSALPDGHG